MEAVKCPRYFEADTVIAQTETSCMDEAVTPPLYTYRGGVACCAGTGAFTFLSKGIDCAAEFLPKFIIRSLSTSGIRVSKSKFLCIQLMLVKVRLPALRSDLYCDLYSAVSGGYHYSLRRPSILYCSLFNGLSHLLDLYPLTFIPLLRLTFLVCFLNSATIVTSTLRSHPLYISSRSRSRPAMISRCYSIKILPCRFLLSTRISS